MDELNWSLLLGLESFICNNHNSWAKANGQGDMQTCSRQNVVSSKSIIIVYHSFKLDYIAFFPWWCTRLLWKFERPMVHFAKQVLYFTLVIISLRILQIASCLKTKKRAVCLWSGILILLTTTTIRSIDDWTTSTKVLHKVAIEL